jgi:hypothetical protein
VHSAFRVGRNVKVVHVQAAGKHDAHAWDCVERAFPTVEGETIVRMHRSRA